MSELRADSLRLRQGDFRLNDVSLECASGGCLAIVGRSGSGKTTCLEIMAGLRRADSGRVQIAGRDVTDLPPERRSVSYLPQDVALFPHLSVRENILFPARMRRTVVDPLRLRDTCEMLGIEPLLERRQVSSLSGGEAQRVAIARAFTVPPQVLFLDECFGSLDAPLRRRLARQFRELRLKTGTTTILVTHDLSEACLMADHLAVLSRGTLEQFATPEDLHHCPATVEVAELLGMHNLLPIRSCQVSGDHWRCDLGPFDLTVHRSAAAGLAPRCLGFFARDLRLVGDRDSRDAATHPGVNRLQLRVIDTLRDGAERQLLLAGDVDPRIVLEAHWPNGGGTRLPQVGDEVSAEIRTDRIRVWS